MITEREEQNLPNAIDLSAPKSLPRKTFGQSVPKSIDEQMRYLDELISDDNRLHLGQSVSATYADMERLHNRNNSHRGVSGTVSEAEKLLNSQRNEQRKTRTDIEFDGQGNVSMPKPEQSLLSKAIGLMPPSVAALVTLGATGMTQLESFVGANSLDYREAFVYFTNNPSIEALLPAPVLALFAYMLRRMRAPNTVPQYELDHAITSYDALKEHKERSLETLGTRLLNRDIEFDAMVSEKDSEYEDMVAIKDARIEQLEEERDYFRGTIPSGSDTPSIPQAVDAVANKIVLGDPSLTDRSVREAYNELLEKYGALEESEAMQHDLAEKYQSEVGRLNAEIGQLNGANQRYLRSNQKLMSERDKALQAKHATSGHAHLIEEKDAYIRSLLENEQLLRDRINERNVRLKQLGDGTVERLKRENEELLNKLKRARAYIKTKARLSDAGADMVFVDPNSVSPQTNLIIEFRSHTRSELINRIQELRQMFFVATNQVQAQEETIDELKDQLSDQADKIKLLRGQAPKDVDSDIEELLGEIDSVRIKLNKKTKESLDLQERLKNANIRANDAGAEISKLGDQVADLKVQIEDLSDENNTLTEAAEDHAFVIKKLKDEHKAELAESKAQKPLGEYYDDGDDTVELSLKDTYDNWFSTDDNDGTVVVETDEDKEGVPVPPKEMYDAETDKDDRPISERHNNPGNIITSTGSPWNGEDSTNEHRLAKFSSVVSGTRAMMYLLYVYYYKHGLKTVHDIIHRWSPADGEGNSPEITDNYIIAVARDMGVNTRDHLHLSSPATISDLVVAMAKHEGGRRNEQLTTEVLKQAFNALPNGLATTGNKT